MIDSRHKYNPSNQNEEYYTIKSFRASRDGIDYNGEYYLMRSRPIGTTTGFRENNKIKKFFLSKQPIQNVSDQFCISIKQDWVGKVLENICWEQNYHKMTTWDHIGRPEIHAAFNNKRKEMGI